MFRLILTGSRWYNHPSSIFRVLESFYISDQVREKGGLVVVHGDCRTGADRIGKIWVQQLQQSRPRIPVDHDPYEAHWRLFGPEAGPRRNRQMAKDGADACVAFPIEGLVCKGTMGMVEEAKEMNIPVRIYQLPHVLYTKMNRKVKKNAPA